MNYKCMIPINIIENEGGDPEYVFCGEPATHKVPSSDWFVCDAHANTMMKENVWEVIPIMGENND